MRTFSLIAICFAITSMYGCSGSNKSANAAVVADSLHFATENLTEEESKATVAFLKLSKAEQRVQLTNVIEERLKDPKTARVFVTANVASLDALTPEKRKSMAKQIARPMITIINARAAEIQAKDGTSDEDAEEEDE